MDRGLITIDLTDTERNNGIHLANLPFSPENFATLSLIVGGKSFGTYEDVALARFADDRRQSLDLATDHSVDCLTRHHPYIAGADNVLSYTYRVPNTDQFTCQTGVYSAQISRLDRPDIIRDHILPSIIRRSLQLSSPANLYIVAFHAPDETVWKTALIWFHLNTVRPTHYRKKWYFGRVLLADPIYVFRSFVEGFPLADVADESFNIRFQY